MITEKIDYHNVLIIAYYFPPLGGAGVQRTLKFAKYLPKFSWQPHILTCKIHGTYATDDTLSEDIPADAHVSRTNSIEPDPFFLLLIKLRLGRIATFIRRWTFIPDTRIGWIPDSVIQGRKLIKQHKIDLLYTTSAPYSSHLIGLLLKKLTGIPWVADFRDEWTQNAFSDYPTNFHKMVNRFLEKQVLIHADKIISVSPLITQGLSKLVQGLPETKFATLTNGYDSEDFLEPVSITENGKFSLLYTGTLYGARTANYFLDAVSKLINEQKNLEEQIEINFIGTFSNLENEINKRELGNLVHNIGYLPHKETIIRQKQADVLILFLPSVGGDSAYTGKIFEYLAARRIILALVPPEGVASQLIQNLNAGIVVEPENVNAISETLLKLYHKWEDGKLTIDSDLSLIEKFDRVNITRNLAQIFDELNQIPHSHHPN